MNDRAIADDLSIDLPAADVARDSALNYFAALAACPGDDAVAFADRGGAEVYSCSNGSGEGL